MEVGARGQPRAGASGRGAVVRGGGAEVEDEYAVGGAGDEMRGQGDMRCSGGARSRSFDAGRRRSRRAGKRNKGAMTYARPISVCGCAWIADKVEISRERKNK